LDSGGGDLTLEAGVFESFVSAYMGGVALIAKDYLSTSPVRNRHSLLACVLPACRGLARPAVQFLHYIPPAIRDQQEA
jgi:hypothetical protein